ncbi:hypothetical protein Acr_11g0009120 [Actinidia rufa]|uniref:Uncharacterized protein n=1 Tax=Actinidia rufa TaxID=165716 RepID=A0A7J0FDW0_9ERIC|nr:hypothetical protein Acr_11g0009120 [Actinidia rufa]
MITTLSPHLDPSVFSSSGYCPLLWNTTFQIVKTPHLMKTSPSIARQMNPKTTLKTIIFSSNTKFVPKDQPFLVPIQCVCNGGGFFEAELTRTALKGESFDDIASSWEGLTDCEAIREKKPDSVAVESWREGEGDLVLDLALALALKFNLTSEAIVSANNRSGATGIAILAAFWVIQWRRKKEISGKMVDLELQQLGLSIRTTSEKVSFDHGSQGTLDGPIFVESTPRKWLVETYTVEELRKATKDFSSSNLIEGSVFHRRLNGKNLAIKGTKPRLWLKSICQVRIPQSQGLAPPWAGDEEPLHRLQLLFPKLEPTAKKSASTSPWPYITCTTSQSLVMFTVT